MPAFREFASLYPNCRTLQDKMLSIDQLIHAVHESFGFVYTKPAAHNLIEGRNSEVQALLDELAENDRVSAEREGVRQQYRDKMAASQKPTAQHEKRVRQRRQSPGSHP
jgi:hypothetical protein